MRRVLGVVGRVSLAGMLLGAGADMPVALADTVSIAGAPVARDRPNPVGLTVAAYEDTARRDWSGSHNRPLLTAIWYPAAAGTREAEWSISIFNAGFNARDAAMAASPAKLPLVLLSHGTGGAAATLGWLAEALASHGYMVAAVNHHGNTAAEPAYRLEGTMVWWDRPQDLSVLLDRLLADPRFGPRIDTARIGVAGFSIGGYTSLAAVGARLSYTQWQGFCTANPADANCSMPPELAGQFSMADVQRLLAQDPRVKAALPHMGDGFKDSRIRSAFAMAPVLGPVMTLESLAAVNVPVHLVVGSDDDQAVPGRNAGPMAANLPQASLEVLPGVTHYTFLADCNLRGKLIARRVCADPAGVDRRAIHQQVSRSALAFFGRTLP